MTSFSYRKSFVEFSSIVFFESENVAAALASVTEITVHLKHRVHVETL
jgi:hypothetical protein